MADDETPVERVEPVAYPVRYDVERPEADRDRLTTAFRLILIIPIAVVLAVVGGGFWPGGPGDSFDDTRQVFVIGGGLLFFGPLLMILFRQKYPRWWFDWNVALLRFGNRVTAYLTLLRDEYPSTDAQQAVHLDLDYPDAQRDINRWLPLVKWFLAIPHYIVLFFLHLALVVCVIVAWFAILFTGRYPRDLFDFVVGVLRWNNRVVGYAVVLVTDRYPPFRLTP